MNHPNDVAIYSLPDSEKRRLCIQLLSEFGATSYKEMSDGSLMHRCLMPFHEDRHPSASLNYRILAYNCLSCHSSGSILWLIATCRGTGTHQARQWLTQEAGDDGSLVSLLKFFDSLYHPSFENEIIPRYSTKVLEPWAYRHPYLEEVRRVPPETQDRFCIGYDPKSVRIIIPMFWKIKDQVELVGWQSRRLQNDGTAKYIFSPAMPRGQILYNFHKKDRVIVVESAMSVLTQWKDTPEISSTLGSNVTDRQIRLLANYSDVILFFDNDEAGWKATQTVGERLLPYNKIRVVNNPYNADAGDLLVNDFKELIETAVPFELWQRPKELKVYERSNPSGGS